MPGKRGRAVRLRNSRRGESRPAGVPAQVADPAGAHPPRTIGRLHGRHLRAPHRQDRGQPVDPRPGRHQPGHRRRLRLPGRHADADDHRAEADQEVQAGPLPDPRRGRHDAAADQVHPPTGLRRQHSLAGPRGVPPGRGREARRGAPGAAGGHRRRADRQPAHPAEPEPPAAGGIQGDLRRGGEAARRAQPDPGDRRRGQPQDDRQGPQATDRQDRHSLRHHPDGQGRGRRASPALPRQRRAVRRRLRASRGGGGRPDRQRRPRRDREAAVLHGSRRYRGDP